jgi:hypothetical protein
VAGTPVALHHPGLGEQPAPPPRRDDRGREPHLPGDGHHRRRG